MIQSFSVKNFRSIKEKVTLSFEATTSEDLEEYYIIRPKQGVRLLKLGIIYGPNASGKTNILHALDFVRSLVLTAPEKKTEKIDYDRFAFDAAFQKEPSEAELIFFVNGTKYTYGLVFDNFSILAETLHIHSPNRANVYKRSTDVQNQFVSIDFGKKSNMDDEAINRLNTNAIWNATVLATYLKTNVQSEILQEVTAWFKSTLKSIVLPKTDLTSYILKAVEQNEIDKKQQLQLLRNADFNISEILIEEEELDIDSDLIKLLGKSSNLPTDLLGDLGKRKKIQKIDISFRHQTDSSSGVLNYEEESRGTQRYFQLTGILAMSLKSELIFPIDELESSLHPDLFKHFLLSFLVNSKNSQFIVTTHLREFLKERDIFRDDVIWYTEKQTDGSTDLYSLDDFDSSVVRNTSSVYNAYRIGKLGATPNLGDYYIPE